MDNNEFTTVIPMNDGYKTYTEPITKEQLDEANNKLLYALADCDNIRKRYINQIADINKYKYEGLIKELLPIIDNFERAFHTYNDNHDSLTEKGKEILDGMNLIYKNFCKILKDNGLMKMKINVGNPFNVECMECVSMVDSDDYESGDVIDIIKQGYIYNDKIVRYAQVVVKK